MNRTLQSVRFTLLFLLLALVVAEAWLAITAALYSHQTPGGFANWFGEIKFSFWQLISFQTKPSPRPDNTRMLVVLLGAILVVVAALCLVVRLKDWNSDPLVSQCRPCCTVWRSDWKPSRSASKLCLADWNVRCHLRKPFRHRRETAASRWTLMTMKNPSHPGEIIREEVLASLGLTVTEAAKALGVARPTLSDLLNRNNATAGGRIALPHRCHAGR